MLRTLCKLISFILILVPLAAIAQNRPDAGSAETANGVDVDRYALRNFSGDAIPDGMIYRVFVDGLVATATHIGEADAVHSLVDDFKLPHDDTGTQDATSLFAYFEETHYLLQDETTSMRVSAMCSPERSSWTRNQVYEAFYKGDDEDERIADKYYRAAMKNLTEREFVMLDGYLKKLKQSTGYKTLDYEPFYNEKMTAVDIRDDLETVCARLAAKSKE